MSKAYTVLIDNFLSSELGVGFDANGIDAIANATEDQLDLFRSHWGETDRSNHEDRVNQKLNRSENGVISVEREGIPTHLVKATSALFRHPYNGLTPPDMNLMKRQALLFSRVAVITPQPDIYDGDLEEKRENLKTYLMRMLEMKPLVKDETVDLIPIQGFYSNEIEGGAGIVREACNKNDALRRWITSQSVSLDDFSRTARRDDPFFDAGISICSALAYDQTLAAVHPFVGGLYKQLVADAPRLDRSEVAATRMLARIDLPGFANLTWADIKSVRDSEECLARWRADLQVAISSVDPDLEADKYIERFDSQVQAHLTRAALELDRELKGSSAMTRFKKGSSSLAMSAVAATAKVLVFGPGAIWTEVLSVFNKEGPKEAIRFLWESKQQSGKQALRSHYAVFSRKT